MAEANCVISRYCAPITGASASRSTNPLQAHLELLDWLRRHAPATIPIAAQRIDLQSRAEHLREVLAAVSAYVSLLLSDAAQNVPGVLDLRQIEALLADLSSEMAGTLQKGADALPGSWA